MKWTNPNIYKRFGKQFACVLQRKLLNCFTFAAIVDLGNLLKILAIWLKKKKIVLLLMSLSLNYFFYIDGAVIVSSSFGRSKHQM